jgi:hypothetical protein
MDGLKKVLGMFLFGEHLMLIILDDWVIGQISRETGDYSDVCRAGSVIHGVYFV